MGLLRDLTAPQPIGRTEDAGPIRDLISAIVTADGSVDLAEHVTVEALYESVPQLRQAPASSRPPATGRTSLIAEMERVREPRLRRQLFVLAVDLALASEGATEREDSFIEELQEALHIDEAFAKQTITVLACKYARSR